MLTLIQVSLKLNFNVCSELDPPNGAVNEYLPVRAGIVPFGGVKIFKINGHRRRAYCSGRGHSALNITILTVGRIREKPIAALCEEYTGRIRKYGHRVSIVEIKDEPGDGQPARILAGEAGRLRSHIPRDAYSIALDVSGETFSSNALAEKLGDLMMQGSNEVVFLIGGPLGLDRDLVAGCRWVFSLSSLTFTHEMSRLILLEQLYRANTILRGEPYHK